MNEPPRPRRPRTDRKEVQTVVNFIYITILTWCAFTSAIPALVWISASAALFLLIAVMVDAAY